MTGLRVLSPGLYSLVVDRGRPRSRSLGVPVGGAADRLSLTLGNALVGNPPTAAALEINLSGPTLQATCRLACVVLGGPVEVATDRRQLIMGKTFTLEPEEELRLGGMQAGMRAYLCVRGGIQTPEVLGSRSALAPLRAGDELPCFPGSIAGRFVRLDSDAEAIDPVARVGSGSPVPLLVLQGTQASWFDFAAFVGQTWTISPQSNRMGLRLEGKPLTVPDREMVSEPVCPGTVQVTRDGQCVILGVDGQTIGGYPRIAQVISADLDLVGQLRPGTEVAFRQVMLEEAEAIYRRQRAELNRWLLRLRLAEEYPFPCRTGTAPH